jgi:hypothetical protein
VVVPYESTSPRAVELARRIALTHGASLRIVGTADAQEEATRAAARHANASGGVTFTELSTAEAVEAVLATGDGADLVVLPLDPRAGDDGNRRVWSTTPVLAVVERARAAQQPPPADGPEIAVAERVEEVVP